MCIFTGLDRRTAIAVEDCWKRHAHRLSPVLNRWKTPWKNISLRMVPAVMAKPIVQTPSHARRRAFIVVIALFPFVFLLVLELFLRAVGYGPDLALLTTRVIGDKTYLQMNPEVGERYFSRVSFHPATSPDLLSVPKPPGTFRIFCLGGSTTVGFPYGYNGAFSSYLRDRLRMIFPTRNVEVINVGLTATNSFSTLDLARDCLRHEPDLLIVYDGHNEFYGALGVASRETLGDSRWVTNLALRLIRWKTAFFARDLLNRIRSLLGSETDDPPGMMMERLARGANIPYSGEVYRRTLSAFTENLHDLCSVCADARVPLILSTQVSNLRDLPPFASGDPPGTTPAAQTEFSQLMNSGISLSLDGKIDSALAVFRAALRYDTLRAETWYRIAQSLDALGDHRAARMAYIKARDFDQLRFRASSDFNGALRNAAADQGALLVDVEALFMSRSPDSLIGNTLLFEHLHPRARGYFLLARAYANGIREHRLLGTPAEWERADSISEDRLWAEREVTEFDDIVARRRIEILTSGWPFQPHTRQAKQPAPDDTLATIADELIGQRIDWEGAHRAATRYYLNRHDSAQAFKENEVIFRQEPFHAVDTAAPRLPGTARDQP